MRPRGLLYRRAWSLSDPNLLAVKCSLHKSRKNKCPNVFFKSASHCKFVISIWISAGTAITLTSNITEITWLGFHTILARTLILKTETKSLLKELNFSRVCIGISSYFRSQNWEMRLTVWSQLPFSQFSLPLERCYFVEQFMEMKFPPCWLLFNSVMCWAMSMRNVKSHIQ